MAVIFQDRLKVIDLVRILYHDRIPLWQGWMHTSARFRPNFSAERLF
jgi:hypothetical protein